MTNHIHLRVEFGGGAELLFGNRKRHDVALHAGPGKCTLSDLIMWLKTNLLKGKEELFVQGNTVRPGILVLVNDTDWELLASDVSIIFGGSEVDLNVKLNLMTQYFLYQHCMVDKKSIAIFAHCFHAQTVTSHPNMAMETSQSPIKPQSNPGLFIQYAPVTPQVF